MSLTQLDHDETPRITPLPNFEPARRQLVPIAAQPGRDRNRAIDALRGLAIVLMVLDHTRDFYFGIATRPTDLAVTTPALFFTRWITHVCAPAFVFLAGTAAFLYGARHTRSELTRFLLVRGALLVVLELTVVRFCWIPEPFYRMSLLQVIWAIGWGLLLLAAVVRLRTATLVLLAAVLTAGYVSIAQLDPKVFGDAGWLFRLLVQRSVFHPTPDRTILVTYPILPWFVLMLWGYAFGAWMRLPRELRGRRSLQLGLVLTGAFLALRGLAAFGDPVPWQPQGSPLWTAMAFVNCEKYPPSLLYMLMTLGPALCLLGWFELAATGAHRPWLRRTLSVLAVFGGVPLFCYVVHLAALRFSALPMAYARFGMAAFTPPPGPAGSPQFPLWVTYLVWLVALVLMYPAARWFLAKKTARPNSWLSYF
jgi:uncharacterized membrane protein